MADARVYLDWNATAPLRAGARTAMLSALDLAGNPSSVHGEGRKARAIVEQARRDVAALVDTKPAHVIFTSGASEAASHVLTPRFRMGKAAVTMGALYVSAIEHPAVLNGGRFPADRVHSIAVGGNGVIDLSTLEAALGGHDKASGMAMVAIQLVNNETGVIQPVAEAADIVKAHGGVLVVDAVQAAGRMKLSMDALKADFLILSAHKMGGPKGAGALISAGEILMPEPLVSGGGQEKGHRAGTENLPAIAGFGAAASEAAAEAADFGETVGALRDALEAGMLSSAPDLIIHGATAPRVANTSFATLPGLKAETTQIAFDLEGFAVSAGSACSSGKIGTSHVLEAMGADAKTGGIRISLGKTTTRAQIDAFLAAFARIASRRSRAQGAEVEAA